jgi:putative chitinase
MITVAYLIAAGVQPTQARVFAEPLARACGRFDITGRARVAAFVAQACHESLGFTRLEEQLYYRSPERIREVFKRLRGLGMDELAKLAKNPEGLANRAYANVNGNGDVASGDGWKYRGRGLFQLTGRANYMAAGDALAHDYKGHPELVALPIDAAMTAAWYWAAAGCNPLADSAQIDAITRAINGPAMLAADERRSLYDEALRAFA